MTARCSAWAPCCRAESLRDQAGGEHLDRNRPGGDRTVALVSPALITAGTLRCEPGDNNPRSQPITHWPPFLAGAGPITSGISALT
jgi:hypothetical protein